jgi:hydroxyacylglutathione hydrolase
MTKLLFHQYPYGSDNYGVLVHDPQSKATACVDVGDASKAIKALEEKNWSLTEIWITHHHPDHTDGLQELKMKTGAFVYGPKLVSQHIEGLDLELTQDDQFIFADQTVKIIHTPGHTTDMINFYLPSHTTLFSGDTLFALGCGRLFEGTPYMMWKSLQKLMELPEQTTIYCSHEYTLANAHFSLSIDPSNSLLKDRVKSIESLRKANIPTIPTKLKVELDTNPFLRASDRIIRENLNMKNSSDAEVFEKIRTLKDTF